MKTLSVQQMPNGFELEQPTFWDWMKAGMAFTLGAGVVTVIGALTWWVIGMAMMAAYFSRSIR